MNSILDVIIAATAVWGAAISTYLLVESRRHSSPSLSVNPTNDDLTKLELKIVNRSKEPIVVVSVSEGHGNNSKWKSVSPENDTIRRMISLHLSGDPAFHLPCEPGQSVRLTVYIEEGTMFALSAKVGWHYDRPADRYRKTIRGYWTRQELELLRDHAAEI